WWGRPAEPPPAVEQAASLEHAADGADRGHLLVPGTEGGVDGDRSMLAEDALAQLPAQRDDGVLELHRNAASPVRRPRTIAPVDLLECEVPGSLDPQLDGRERDAHLARHRAL